MVRASLLCLTALAWANLAHAQTADWGRAGGGLFAGGALAPPPPGPPTDVEVPHIRPLRQPYGEAISAAADLYGLDPKLLHALVVVESAYRPDARSPAGAGGLTQLMPETASSLGVRDRFDPTENVTGGAAYLARQMLRFGDLRLALAAYNAGPGRVVALGRVPNLGETRAYVAAVVDCYLALTAGRRVRSARECRTAGGTP
ncbi:lytic transglycosylase domain-containing protein [Phenylobacterium sp.]|jgi:soluble lytic murein transglycosylase-like protein|uniref:lytic transglycosylase domain-containing protein n=1 Tax=Phenylobacterium sp. TaxID=1871053 RepID=UPI002E32EB27|nr:lytic transglycosylase domain-containing protein [Phenylobacterium sp.]HEX4711108.1 lytic transglycosylase domain-containing protein [Phenylobacterium sp.]